MKTAGARIKWAREKIGLSQRAFCAPLGMTQPSVNRWETGDTTIGPSQALLVEAAHGVRKEWILTGEKPVWVAGQAAVDWDKDYLGIPVLMPVPVEDGELVSRAGETMPLPRSVAEEIGTDELRFHVVEGMGMFPVLSPGDMALLDCSMATRTGIIPGELYLVAGHGAAAYRIRRVWTEPSGSWPMLLTLKSANNRYPDKHIRTSEPATVLIGRVTHVWHRLMSSPPLPGDW